MEEREIDKILRPEKKLIFLLIAFLGIAFLCIGLVFHFKFKEKKEPVDFTELIFNGTEQEGQYVEIDIAYLPIILKTTNDRDYYFYYAEDEQKNAYLVRLSNETYRLLTRIGNQEDRKLNELYHLEGFTHNIDFNDIDSVKMSEISGKVYIHENKVTNRDVTIYTIFALIGVFFLVLSFGYVLPGILRARKISKDKKLVEELRTELENLTDVPYKEQHIYLTRNYIISGIQAIKYEDIVCIYILNQTKSGIKIGENLIVHTKDNKKYTIGSVAGNKNDILDNILSDIKSKNTNIKVGYNEANK